jgi:rod shape-determining protein MreC
VYDKTVRRRRLVLAALVAASLLLLTAYFGESAGGGLHLVQRATMAVVAPVEEGLSRAFKPVRDTFGWIGDTVSAKGDLKQARIERQTWRARAIAGEAAIRQNQQLLAELNLQNDNVKYNPVNARVIGDSPTLWYTSIWIDKGSSAGIATDMPVMGTDGRNQSKGLVGVVAAVAPNASRVTLITDHSVSISAHVVTTGVEGVLQASVGNPYDLEMQYVSSSDPIAEGDIIATAGTTSKRSQLESVYPPDLPIGRVTDITSPQSDSQVVHVSPFVNMKRIEFVQVLTHKVDDNRK